MDSWLNWNWFIIHTWMHEIGLIPWVKGIELLSEPNWWTVKLDNALLVYLASRYRIHFTENTPAQDLLQNRYKYIIHNTQNHTQWTYRVHTTLEEN